MSLKISEQYKNFLLKSDKSDSTKIAYHADVEQLMKFLGKKDVNKALLSKYIAYLNSTNLTKKTIARKVNSLRHFFKFLQSKNYIDSNPIVDISFPKPTHKPQRILNRNECRKLIETSKSNPKIYTVINLILHSGIRIGEVSRLKVEDIKLDLKDPQIHIKKYSTLADRKIKISDKLMFILKDYMNSHEHISENNFPFFYTSNKKNINIRNLRTSINRIISKSKIENICVNDLRNTFIVRQLEVGNSMGFVANVVGHKTKLTTERYIRLLKKPYKDKQLNKIEDL